MFLLSGIVTVVLQSGCLHLNRNLLKSESFFVLQSHTVATWNTWLRLFVRLIYIGLCTSGIACRDGHFGFSINNFTMSELFQERAS
jgi:hypothetical protein